MSNLTALLALAAPLIALVLRLADVMGGTGMIDIQAFVAAGELVRQHGVAASYDEAAVKAMQTALSGSAEYMPWSYPPTTSALMAPLAALDWRLAQLLLGLASIGGVAWFARRHAPDAPTRNTALVLMAGPLTVNVASGQFGALFALALGLALAGRRSFAFALVALKPHLLGGPVVAGLADRRVFYALAGGGLITLVGFGLVEWIYPGSVAGWLAALRYSGAYLAAGAYQLGRMVSAYAFFRTLAGHEVALAAHLATAAVVIGASAWIVRAAPAQIRLVVLAVAGLTLSPYMHDYDMVILGLALLLLVKAGAIATVPPGLILSIATAGVGGMVSLPLFEATGKCLPTFLALAASAILMARMAAGGARQSERHILSTGNA